MEPPQDLRECRGEGEERDCARDGLPDRLGRWWSRGPRSAGPDRRQRRVDHPGSRTLGSPSPAAEPGHWSCALTPSRLQASRAKVPDPSKGVSQSSVALGLANVTLTNCLELVSKNREVESPAGEFSAFLFHFGLLLFKWLCAGHRILNEAGLLCPNSSSGNLVPLGSRGQGAPRPWR